ncbi:DegQ family serine endoprotease [Desulfurella sp.]|uniref:DegQ family serine endoprotease n=1 Tax=Desulfurella sp. TaxID=1962857 RepID=UPI0025BA87AD|nr:DegQ family serine endoprotease [Desulfurella sp.]
MRFFKKLSLLIVLAVFLSVNAYAQTISLPNFTPIAEKVLPAVVNISTTQVVKGSVNPFGEMFSNSPFNDFFKHFFQGFQRNYKAHFLGSGFIISSNGYILTNYHVVKNATDINVTLNTNEIYKAKIVGYDPEVDIALLKINPRRPLPTLELGNSNKMEIGQWVLAVGNPFGLSGTVTSGIISAKGRVIGEGPFDHFIQTDAAINPGNSGGPLVNMDGKVIGMNTAIIASGQGIGFAIPSDTIKYELPYLMKGEVPKRGWLGVGIQLLTPEVADLLKLKSLNGAIVNEVFKNSPAAKAGIEPGDVIVSMNGKSIYAPDLPYDIAFTKPGTKVELGIIRNGKEITKTVILGQRPQKENQEQLETQPSVQSSAYNTPYGFSIAAINPNLEKMYNLKEQKGVVITSVDPNSFAALAGIKPGDVVIKLDNENVYSVEQFKNILKQKPNENVISMLLKRGESTLFVTIQKS